MQCVIKMLRVRFSGRGKVRLAEARFLRAFYYQLLWMFTGVPIITDVLNLTEQGEDIFHLGQLPVSCDF